MNLKFLHSIHALESSKTLEGHLGCSGNKLDETGSVCLIKGAQSPPEPLDLNEQRFVLTIVEYTREVYNYTLGSLLEASGAIFMVEYSAYTRRGPPGGTLANLLPLPLETFRT